MSIFQRNKTGIEQLKKNKKLGDLDKYIIFSFAVMIIYTIFEFIFSTITGVSHDTLTTCLYGAFGGELLMCALIKRFKLKRG
jgi:preprotein translocase subunit SecY